MERNKLLLILFCFALVAACGNTPSTSGSTQSTPTPTPSHHHKIDEKVEASPWEITIGKGHTQPDFHTEYVSMTPSTPGYVFLVFPVTARNTSASEQNMSVLDYRLRDTAGNPYNGSGMTFEGRVEAGAPLKGTLVFEVPPGERKYVLMFAPTPQSALTIWDV
jgi:hypothetical protein